MTKRPISVAVCLLTVGSAVMGAAPADPLMAGRAALMVSARAYRDVAAMRDTIAYVVKSSGENPEPKRIEIRLGSGTNVSVEDALLRAVAVGKTFYVTKTDAPDKYLQRLYSGDFRGSLESVAGKSSLFEPVQVSMRLGRSLDACIDGLRFNQLAPLHIVGYGQVNDEHGRRVDEIRFVADNGRLDARLDAKTHFFSSLRMAFQPAGAPSGVTVEVLADFSPQVLSQAVGVVAFDPGTRRAVANVVDLDSESLPTGKPAPAFDLETPGGQRVSLTSMKGRVVLVDFWATWCAPCWKTLGEAQQVFQWASANHLPVAVVTVDTMEHFPTEQERKDRVTALFKSRGFTLPTLLDHGSAVLEAFGSPGLPSSVLISADGTILKFHQGIFPNMAETLRAEVSAALPAASR